MFLMNSQELALWRESQPISFIQCSKESPRKKQIEAWNKSIEKENKVTQVKILSFEGKFYSIFIRVSLGGMQKFTKIYL